MKLKHYAKQISMLAQEHPDLEVYYAIDEEGNGFKPVHYEPAVGMIAQGSFYTKKEAKQIMGSVINAVCIN